MTVYTPPRFVGSDRDAAHALIAAHPFATLITTIDSAEPQVTHLPLLLEGEALVGHMARPNPHWALFGRGHTLALFHGPHAYVSPLWYQQPALHVPTWNYATVHVGGRPELLSADDSRASLQRLTRRFDPDLAIDTSVIDRLLPGIVAFRMPIDALTAKFKMSQNRTPADRGGVIAGLLAADSAAARNTARWMQTHD